MAKKMQPTSEQRLFEKFEKMIKDSAKQGFEAVELDKKKVDSKTWIILKNEFETRGFKMIEKPKNYIVEW